MISDWKGVLVSIGIAISILFGVWQIQAHYQARFDGILIELRTELRNIDRRLDDIDRRLARVEGVLSVRELPLQSPLSS